MRRTVISVFLIFALLCTAAETRLAASGSHALYLDDSGRAWAWGSNIRGESSPESAETRILEPEAVFENALDIACGARFSLALDAQGRVWLWGENAGIIENAPTRLDAPELLFEDASQIASDGESLAVLLKNGLLMYWNSEWHEFQGVSRAAVGADFVLILKENGEACFWGDPDYVALKDPLSEPVTLMSGCAAVYAGGQTGMLISEDGTLYVFGASGAEGRLGLDTGSWVSAPQPNGVIDTALGVPGVSASGAITKDGEMYVWGTLYSFFTAYDDESDTFLQTAAATLINYGKTPIKLYDGVKNAAIGDAFIVAEFTDGRLISWGSNDWGQIGDGYYTAFELYMDADDDDDEADIELIVTDNQQRVFPAYIELN